MDEKAVVALCDKFKADLLALMGGQDEGTADQSGDTSEGPADTMRDRMKSRGL